MITYVDSDGPVCHLHVDVECTEEMRVHNLTLCLLWRHADTIIKAQYLLSLPVSKVRFMRSLQCSITVYVNGSAEHVLKTTG